MFDCHRVLELFLRGIALASLLIVMGAIYQPDDDPGSHYIHPRRVLQ